MKHQFSDIDRLAKDIKQGNVKAFRLLYSLMSVKIFHFAYSYVLSKEEAEEIMDDVFLRIWDKRKAIDTDKSFRSFMFTIAKHLTLDRIRKYSLETVNLQNYFKEAPQHFQDSGEQKLLYDELSETIDKIVMQMPPRRQKVYQLSRNKGMSNKAIAEYLNARC